MSQIDTESPELGLFLEVNASRVRTHPDGRVQIQFRTQAGLVTCELPPGHAETLIAQIRERQASTPKNSSTATWSFGES